MRWIPSLYLAEALPFSAVMLISVLMFKDFGLTDAQITLYTGWMGLPWVIKPLWSTVVDCLRTKRWWIVSMQFVIGIAMALVAFSIPTSYWLQSTLAVFMLIAFASATHDIGADGFYIIALPPREQELYVGLRNTFYRLGMVLGQGGLVMLAGWLPFEQRIAWATVFGVLSVLMLLLALYHRFALPKPEGKAVSQSPDLLIPLRIFFTKPHAVAAIAFILLFRLPEGLLTKIVPLFLTRPIEDGGLGLSNQSFGLIYGTIGVVGLLLGGIVGGALVSKYGLRRMIWPLVLCFTVPDVVYLLLALATPVSEMLVALSVAVEQFGYGLGFAAYTLFLVSYSRGERATTVFSIATAGQYLGGVMLPGMISGWISDRIGYVQFFVVVLATCSITYLVTYLVKPNIICFNRHEDKLLKGEA